MEFISVDVKYVKKKSRFASYDYKEVEEIALETVMEWALEM